MRIGCRVGQAASGTLQEARGVRAGLEGAAYKRAAPPCSWLDLYPPMLSVSASKLSDALQVGSTEDQGVARLHDRDEIEVRLLLR